MFVTDLRRRPARRPVSWRLTGDLDEYLALAGAFLAARPVEHTVLLTVTETLRRARPARVRR